MSQFITDLKQAKFFNIRNIGREAVLNKARKKDVMNQFELHEGDTGSTEVQVAVLTERIRQLTTHMAANRHDYHTQRGLLKLVGRRRRLLAYVNKQNVKRYKSLISRLGLRK